MSDMEKHDIVQKAISAARLVQVSLASKLAKIINAFLQKLVTFEALYEVYLEVPLSIRSRL
jgi:hypothetical protein